METTSEKGYGHVERVNTYQSDMKPSPQYDQFGAAAKIDPKEIALVRKIDIYMMVGDLCRVTH